MSKMRVLLIGLAVVLLVTLGVAYRYITAGGQQGEVPLRECATGARFQVLLETNGCRFVRKLRLSTNSGPRVMAKCGPLRLTDVLSLRAQQTR